MLTKIGNDITKAKDDELLVAIIPSIIAVKRNQSFYNPQERVWVEARSFF